MLILAVTVFVGEYIVGWMRLVTADAEIEANIVNVERHVVEDGAELVVVGCESLGERVCLGLNAWGNNEGITLQRVVPGANLFPVGKGGYLDRRFPTLD